MRHTIEQLKTQFAAFHHLRGIPLTSADCMRLAQKYEKAARRWRTAKHPPERKDIAAGYQTARAYYSLAREL